MQREIEEWIMKATHEMEKQERTRTGLKNESTQNSMMMRIMIGWQGGTARRVQTGTTTIPICACPRKKGWKAAAWYQRTRSSGSGLPKKPPTSARNQNNKKEEPD